ncbi:uncharacterized protein BXZ73DRAFT_89556 [Epithele typhae]|uniref:uncharacterized protein n=1 Tax=Epithele typhae TaxID=378194 RepID=UPI0020073C5F|nr:uncharacterized protein BXZ73DRAFT_89556 [Epithele typhae]KAH9935228.1 hypothetical protein BXZ73DRAFT_89556 [Epithele typhae]
MPEVSRQEAESSYQKAAGAELARDFDKAFRLYVHRRSVDDRARAQHKAEAAKALERAEKIKAVKQDVRPVSKDEFSESEQLYVLQKSAVNQGHFPLWDAPDKPSCSSQQPPLSAEQVAHGAVWRRPAVLPPQALEPEDIVQHIVSDCSVCASMVIATDHRRRFRTKMILSSLFPQDATGFPAPSATGKYQLRILYNGGHRRVRIDDQLPSYPDGPLMCVSTGSKGQLWPSLVEKAYMKLAGGYDFIGSALAGWIPEALDIRTCVATFGTGQRISTGNLPISLLPTHCYAMIGITNSGEDRRAIVFDPWTTDLTLCIGAVELPIELLFSLFDGLYLSWNPETFKYQHAFHWLPPVRNALWILILPRLNRISPAAHYRTHLKIDDTNGAREGEEVWILLTRHLRSHRSQEEFIALTAHTGSGAASATIPVLRLPISPSEQLITLVASYEGERDDVGFTLTVYANSRTMWVHAPQELLYSKDIEGAFTQKTAGGNHTYPTYYLNPQYHLRVHPPRRPTSSSGRRATSHRPPRPVNMVLAWSQGGRINELGHNDLALSSGAYSYGYAHAAGRIPPGDYTLVISAFEPRHSGKFGLRAECSDRFELTPVQQEGAGMFSKLVRGEWCVSVVRRTSPLGPILRRGVGRADRERDAAAGALLVVPSTFHAGVEAGFRLLVYSNVSGVALQPAER